MLFMKKIFLGLIALFLFTTIKAQVNKQDSLALVDLYDSTGGPNWTNHTNWLTSAPLSSWGGITVNTARVTKLQLGSNNLIGHLPITIGQLSNLQQLILNNNVLSDSIPSSIGNLSKLTLLYFYNNKFNGSIPSSLGNLSNLTTLGLYSNQLSGNLPSSLGQLSKLTLLTVWGNNLSGNIPSEIGALSLSTLYLDNNHFSGTIPPLKGTYTHLTLSSNNLTFAGMEAVANGALSTASYSPQASVPLTNNSNTLFVSVGGTPSNNTFKWYQNGKLLATKIGDSTFTPISSGNYYVVATNAIATKLTLYSDTLNIFIGSAMQDSLALVDFYNSTNGVSWTNNSNWLSKSPLGTWHGITLDSNGRVSNIQLFNNNLSGKLLPSIGNLTALTGISLHFGLIGDTIPASVGNLINLNNLDLGSNKFIGTIPSTIGNMNALTEIDLSGNQLTGTIPESIGNLKNLIALWLEYNNLSGSIPSSFGNMSNLNNLVLEHNQLIGTIPTTFGNLSKLGNLILKNNQLVSPIPASLANLKLLNQLFLENNQFTFDGMELIAQKFPFVQYAPQAPIPLHQVGLLSDSTYLYVSVGGTPKNGLYQWYKDGELVATNYVDSFYQILSSGKYSVQATNALLPYFVLYSDTLNISSSVPIKSISLQSKEINGRAILEWHTIDEINTASFIIQQSSDGINFNTIGTKAAIGSGNNNYNFAINGEVNNGDYYRLQAIDKDGSKYYSNATQLQSIVNCGISIYPSPAKDFVTIKGTHIARVSVIDNEGKVVLETSLKDAVNPRIAIDKLVSGNYFIKVTTNEGKQYSNKIVKE